MFKIDIYTDGAASGNPGPGGFGTILLFNKDGKVIKKEISEGYKLTTNNRMELLAVIKGLEALKIDNCNVTIYSDSKYIVDAVEKKWLFEWEKKNFKKKQNIDLWIRFLKVYKKHKIKFVWVKGHNNNKYNEMCDKLAVNAAKQNNLLEDSAYVEKIKLNNDSLLF